MVSLGRKGVFIHTGTMTTQPEDIRTIALEKSAHIEEQLVEIVLILVCYSCGYMEVSQY